MTKVILGAVPTFTASEQAHLNITEQCLTHRKVYAGHSIHNNEYVGISETIETEIHASCKVNNTC